MTTRHTPPSASLPDPYRIAKDSYESIYQFGCEFEFYIDKNKMSIEEAYKTLVKEISIFSNGREILCNMISEPADSDKYECFQIKPDPSLSESDSDDIGIEICTPVTSLDGVIFYVEKIFELIDKYGYTNEKTGLHFHISTVERNGVNLNFYLYMLMCDDKGLLSSWPPREGYSMNVMDILRGYNKKMAKKIKNKKGHIWNVEKIDSNHIELRAMGGTDYQKKLFKVIKELSEYTLLFDMLADRKKKKENMDYFEELRERHEKLLKKTETEDREAYTKFIDATYKFLDSPDPQSTF